MKPTPLKVFTLKITLVGREKGRGGSGTVARNDPCMSSTQEQSIRNIVKQYKLFSMFQKAEIPDLPNF